MTNQVSLHYKKGSHKNYQDIINQFESPDYYWYEPKPESTLDNQHCTLPLNTLTKDQVNIPQNIAFSELMLFYPDAGLVIVNNGEGFDYFYWSESKEDQNSDDIINNVEKKALEVVYQQVNETDKKQLTIQRFMQKDQCLAWTITEGEIK